MTDKPTLDDRIQVATVDHKLRVSALFALVTWAILAVWLALVLAVVCVVALYYALR